MLGNAMAQAAKFLSKIIPLWLKVPTALLFREMGKIPFRLVWQHVRCIYAEVKSMPPQRKERILEKKHRVTLRYLKKKYGAFLSEQSADYSDGKKNENFPIWILWWQGEENAPQIVQQCIAAIRKNAEGHPVHIVTAHNYQTYLHLEQNIIDKMKAGTISLTHFSDIIRMNLLARHGGFWLDSTIFCNRTIGGEEFDRPIFTLRNPGADRTNVSRWEWTGFAIYGWQGGKLFCLMRDFFNRYWQEHDRLIDYFLIDYGIRLICDLCPDVMAHINAIPANNQQLYYYQQHFTEAHPGTLADVDTGNTWLFKLTWKQTYPLLTEGGEKTLYAAWYEEAGKEE